MTAITSPARRCLAAALLILVACARSQPDNALRVSGHVEATEVQISSEVAGRIVDLRLDEGDRVEPGALIAQLDTSDTTLQIDRLRAERAAADAQLRLLQSGTRPEDVRQAEAQVAAADADVKAIGAELMSAELDLLRYESLLQANAGSVKQRDDAQARVDVARARQQAAERRTQAARETEARLRTGARREEVDAARARLAAADAQVATLEKALKDAQVISPVAGIVTQKLVDTGELVGARTPLVVITDLDHAWANLFVPEPMMPRLKLGQKATVLTDAAGQRLAGTVTFMSPKAEFTPRNVQTAEERSKLVYRIKVTVDNTAGILKPGMPVDAELAVQ
jgi:HlyD family secretion protein